MGQFKSIDAINLNNKIDELSEHWSSATPFPFVIIDNFCDSNALNRICEAFPEPKALNKSRDYIFAKNKFEKNEFGNLHPDMQNLKDDLLSDEFATVLKKITNIDLFVDPSFHGGGLHMGGKGSFLDMHADFNIHPEQKKWSREVNILLYLNQGWKKEYGGNLKLRHADTDESAEVEPIFNRAVIMLTKSHTLHGYDPINFPDGEYRKSIASYGYSVMSQEQREYTTLWYSDSSKFKNFIGPRMHRIVKLKNKLFGSGSSNNK